MLPNAFTVHSRAADNSAAAAVRGGIGHSRYYDAHTLVGMYRRPYQPSAVERQVRGSACLPICEAPTLHHCLVVAVAGRGGFLSLCVCAGGGGRGWSGCLGRGESISCFSVRVTPHSDVQCVSRPVPSRLSSLPGLQGCVPRAWFVPGGGGILHALGPTPAYLFSVQICLTVCGMHFCRPR